MSEKCLERLFPNFFDMDTEKKRKHITEQKSVDYLLKLYELIEDSEFEDVDKHYYGTRVYRRIYELVSNNGRR